MSKTPLVIVGDRAFAEVACEYFRHESDYDVVGFAVNRAFRKKETLLDLPVLEIEELTKTAPPETHALFVAVTYGRLNRVRRRLYEELKAQGYRFVSYISKDAFVWHNVKIGENTFVFENNVVQPFVTVGNNVVLWSGNHIGHHSRIGDHCFISSHVVVSGYCTVGDHSFIGVNATLADTVEVGPDCWIGPGALITKNIEKGTIYSAPATQPSKVSSYRFFKVDDA